MYYNYNWPCNLGCEKIGDKMKKIIIGISLFILPLSIFVGLARISNGHNTFVSTSHVYDYILSFPLGIEKDKTIIDTITSFYSSTSEDFILAKNRVANAPNISTVLDFIKNICLFFYSPLILVSNIVIYVFKVIIWIVGFPIYMLSVA